MGTNVEIARAKLGNVAAQAQANVARIIAQRFGVTDPKLLRLVERVASSSMTMSKPKMQGESLVLNGTIEGKPFEIRVSGSAIADFA